MNRQIDEKYPLHIDGARQWLFLRGNPDRPVILFLHGGPGFPLTPFARAFEGLLRDDFLLVHWDQRGAGKSFSSADHLNGLNVQQFVLDGLVVARHLRMRFSSRPLLLVGHSWGTILGARMVARDSALFHAYLSVATVSDVAVGEQFRYTFVQEKLRCEERFDQLAILSEIGPPPWSLRDSQRWASILVEHVPMKWMWGSISRSDLDLAVEACIDAGDYSAQELQDAFEKAVPRTYVEGYYEYSAKDQVPRIEVPVQFLHGELDFNTPGFMAKEYFRFLDAPLGKHWQELAGHGHMVFYESPQRFHEVLMAMAR